MKGWLGEPLQMMREPAISGHGGCLGHQHPLQRKAVMLQKVMNIYHVILPSSTTFVSGLSKGLLRNCKNMISFSVRIHMDKFAIEGLSA